MQGKRTLSVLGAALLAAFATDYSQACSSVIVGKGASADGAIIISRNEDYYINNWNKKLVIHPRRDSDKGEMISFKNGLKVPAPQTMLRYTGLTDWNGDTTAADGPYEERGVNEFNLAVSATNSMDANDAAKKADPLVDTGVIEADIPSFVLPIAKTAREAVALLGKTVKEQGAGEANGILLADPKEVWYMEIGSGHHWIAVKVPQDKYMIVANGMRIHDVDLNDRENVMGSDDLAEFVSKNKLLDKVDVRHFNFAKAFGSVGDRYNIDREWMGQHLLTPSLSQKVRQEQYPMFLKPDHKITVADIGKVLRANFKGTELEKIKDAERPMGVDRTIETHVYELRSDMPKELQVLTWQAFGSPSAAVFMPMYENAMKEVPAALRSGTEVYEGQSAYWAFRANATLAQTNPSKYAPVLAKWQSNIEGTFQGQQAAVDHMLKRLYDQSPEAALRFANQWSNGNVLWAVQSAHDVFQSLMTDMTKSTEKKYTPAELEKIKAL
ncbi:MULTISPECIES: C69 family dipeptidase [unclassified Paludibacterium]|uniref:C69 family dipeptidase n=1 Tax=unclassified Paludibacterium TaxID=2618429 RepID=UPI001C044E61|nr:C69 family dipeptidase [Paludibacterium sp. B53371]BEV72803.1 C69 family dipeptidase [Paludibacterium sp. THUN1379]